MSYWKCPDCIHRQWVENVGINGDYTGWAGCGYATGEHRCKKYELEVKL